MVKAFEVLTKKSIFSIIHGLEAEPSPADVQLQDIKPLFPSIKSGELIKVDPLLEEDLFGLLKLKFPNEESIKNVITRITDKSTLYKIDLENLGPFINT